MTSFLLPLVVLAVFLSCAFGKGVDVSEPLTETDFQCLAKSDVDFAIVRCYQQTGFPDPACPKSVAAAHAAGYKSVSIYLFPCTGAKCPAPGDQIQALHDYITKNGIKYDKLWLDIEGPQYWSKTPSDNQGFFQALVAEAHNLNIPIGVYTSYSQWVPIMGSSYTDGSGYPLWYASYDDNPSFSDFKPFGGWTLPKVAMKQYQGNVKTCGVAVDLDSTPESNTVATHTGSDTGKTHTGSDTGKTHTGSDTGKTHTGSDSGKSHTGSDSGDSGKSHSSSSSSSSSSSGGSSSGSSGSSSDSSSGGSSGSSASSGGSSGSSGFY